MRKLHRIPRTARRFVTKDISFAAMFITVCPPVLSHGKNDDNLPAKKACIRQGCEKSGKRKISYTTKACENFPQKKTAARRFSAPRSHPPIIQPFTYICLYIIVYTVTKSQMCREQRSTRPCCSTLRCSRQRISRRVRSHISAQRGSFCCCSLPFRLSL